MKYTIIAPDSLQSTIYLPASKSISNRALILKALSKSPYDIQHISNCDDTNVMLAAFTSGEKEIDIKAAGTSMRFLTAYFSQLEGEWIITGTERMKNRPIRILVEALEQLGAKIEYIEKEGFPPLKISGAKLQGGRIKLDGTVSSQYISALMMIAPTMSKGLILKLEGDIISKPYIQLTAKMMKDFGITTNWNNDEINIAHQTYIPIPYTVESDWSAASYWYEMIALAPEGSSIELIGLSQNSPQGDAKIAMLFEKLGVQTHFIPDGIQLKKHSNIVDRLDYDFQNEPDMAQTFVVTCALLNVPFRFTGLQSLKIKETDRIVALQNEMKKLGYTINSSGNSILEWDGKQNPAENDPVINTYEDHRMAMAFAPAALIRNKIIINNPEVVTKSYPNYWDDMKNAGFNIQEYL